MAEGEHKGLIISALLMGLFMVLTVTIVYEMGQNYSIDGDKFDQATAGAFDKEEYEAELLANDESASDYRERFESGNVDDVDDPSGIFTILGDLVSMVTTPFRILFEIGTNVLKIPTVVVTTIMAIILASIIFGIWRVIRAGS